MIAVATGLDGGRNRLAGQCSDGWYGADADPRSARGSRPSVLTPNETKKLDIISEQGP